MSKVLIGVPINEEKLYCLPVFLAGLRALIRNTDCDVSVAFALNGIDKGIISEIKKSKIKIWTLPAPRRKVIVPTDHVFTGGGELNHIINICLARNIIREAARVSGADWLFYLDSDGCVAPDAINRLMAHNYKVSACMWSQRTFNKDANPVEPKSWIETTDEFLGWEDVKNREPPITNTNAGFGACLIHRDVIEDVPITFTMKGKEVLYSEDTTFYKQVFEKGIPSCCDQSIRTIHFMEPSRFPYGWTNDNELMTYASFIKKNKQTRNFWKR